MNSAGTAGFVKAVKAIDRPEPAFVCPDGGHALYE